MAAALIDGDTSSALRVVACGVGASAFIWLLFLISPGGMGDGDARLALLLGFGLGWFSWRHAVIGIFAGFRHRRGGGRRLCGREPQGNEGGIPFGPWLALGAWLVVLLADEAAGGLA